MSPSGRWTERRIAMLGGLGIMLAAGVGPSLVVWSLAAMTLAPAPAVFAEEPPPITAELFGDARYLVVYFDGSYFVCQDEDEAARLFVRFPYLATGIDFAGDIDECGWFRYAFERSRPRLTLYVLPAGAEG